jgi:hypothetical protein
VAQAADLAWQHGLRGYDAVHLAAALTWCRSMESPALLATFDRQLWLAARRSGLAVLPSDLVLT